MHLCSSACDALYYSFFTLSVSSAFLISIVIFIGINAQQNSTIRGLQSDIEQLTLKITNMSQTDIGNTQITDLQKEIHHLKRAQSLAATASPKLGRE